MKVVPIDEIHTYDVIDDNGDKIISFTIVNNDAGKRMSIFNIKNKNGFHFLNSDILVVRKVVDALSFAVDIVEEK